VSNEPKDLAAEQPAPAATDEHPLAGFEEAFVGMGFPQEPEGQAEPSEAVDASEAEDTAAQDVKEEPKKDSDTSDEEQGSEAELTVNFDGYPESRKKTWERLLREGHVTEDEFEEDRLGTLMQSNFTKKTQEVAEKRKALDKQIEELGDDYALLQKIRNDKRLHDIWLKMQEGDYQDAGEDSSDDLVTRAEAERLMEERLKKREEERQQRTAKQEAAYQKKVGELREAAIDVMTELGISEEVVNTYLNEEGSETPDGQDPVLYFTPEDLKRALKLRHRAATAEAKAAQLEKQLNQRTSKADRTSKQSSPPARRVAVDVPMTPIARTLADLGVEPDGSNVQGFGHPAGSI